jgi:hypothetical protein
MIADLDETIRQLLKEELPIRNGEIEVSFQQPRRENSARWTKPTVNLYLYDLRENNVLRQHQWQRLAGSSNGGDGRAGDRLAHLKRSPMRVDCCYILTAWANDPEDEHRLLTRCLLALFRFPVLPNDRLVGSLRNPAYEIQSRLASHDKLTNPAEVWGALDNELRPCVSYVVTLALDPWTEVAGPIVRTVTLRSGQSNTLPRYQRLVEGTRGEVSTIGGTVRGKGQGGVPLAGIEVAVKGTGLFARTDCRGRFALGAMPRGEYTLVAWPEEGKPREVQILVPSVDEEGRPVADGDYDLEI